MPRITKLSYHDDLTGEDTHFIFTQGAEYVKIIHKANREEKDRETIKSVNINAIICCAAHTLVNYSYKQWELEG